MRKKTVLFDLGGTLVQYYTRSEIPEVLRQAIAGVQEYLRREGWLRLSPEEVWAGVEREKREAGDHRVRPLEGRLARIFRLEEQACSPELLDALCRCFLKPIFARARRYDDALPVLRRLHADGFRLAVVSNTPWGSPAHLWRKEIARHGLTTWLDVAVFCTDVGWRKPSPHIFTYTLERLAVEPQECVFVGDDPRWDVAGPQAVGIEALLLERDDQSDQGGQSERGRDATPSVPSLGEFYAWLRTER